MKPGSVPATSNSPIAGYDARSDLGYGTLKPKFQNPRSASETYPYVSPDPYAGLEDEDEDTQAAVHKKSIDYLPTDHYAAASTDPFYFVAGNTKLADCFYRPDFVLKEIAAFGDSMSPIPQAYKGRGPSSTGYGPAFPYPGGGGTTAKRTGSFQGWSSTPPPIDFPTNEEEEEFSKEEDTYSLKDMAKKMSIEENFSF